MRNIPQSRRRDPDCFSGLGRPRPVRATPSFSSAPSNSDRQLLPGAIIPHDGLPFSHRYGYFSAFTPYFGAATTTKWNIWIIWIDWTAPSDSATEYQRRRLLAVQSPPPLPLRHAAPAALPAGEIGRPFLRQRLAQVFLQIVGVLDADA